MAPRVSICIPAYQQPDGLRRALESISIQTYTDYGVVISDDSSDGSMARVVDEFRDRLPIRYQLNAPGKGSPENWNEAIRLATGSYIKILHHDDWFSHERSLEEFVRLLDDNPDANIAFCASLFHFPGAAEPSVHRCDQSQLASLRRDPRVLFCSNIAGPPSSTIFRSSPGLLFDRELKWVVDIEFYIRAMSEGGAFAYTDEPLVSVMNGEPSQVTAQCLADNALQVREYAYLYRMITKGRAFNCRLFRHLSLLFYWQGVRTTRDLIRCGVPEPVPSSLRMAVSYSWVLRVQTLMVRAFQWITRTRSSSTRWESA